VPLFFEDVNIGDRFSSGGRTITETDVVTFAALSGDWNQIHTDAEFAAQSPYKQRIAHGFLVLSAMTGLLHNLGLFNGSAIAMLGVEWKFTGPVFFGDTIHVEIEVTGKRLATSGDRGIVERRFTVLNQHGATVQTGTIPLMIKLRA
jgi:acyl dehydratase